MILARRADRSATYKAPGGAAFETTSYAYDQNGNRISQADWSGQSTFQYDTLNRLIQAVHPAGYGTFGWTYDAVGNRTQQTGPGGTVNYTYDQNNRLTQAGSATYSYDNNGNLTAISTGQTFAWDVFNRLTQATGPGGTVTHTFNGDGLKTRRVGPDGTRRYYYDGIRPIWEGSDAGSLLQQYDRDIFGNLLSRRDSAGVRRYYHFDGLGSTTALTNESGAVAATLLYDAWGNLRASTGTPNTRYRFTGAELDPVTGLYHMGARFYDPTIGRWLSEDPVQDKYFEPFTLNFYTYVQNQPLNLVDLTGRNVCDEACREEVSKQDREWVEKLIAALKQAGSITQARAAVEAWAKALEHLPAAVAARIASVAALAAGGLALSAAIVGDSRMANTFSMGSIVAASVAGFFTAMQYNQGQMPSMAHAVAQGFTAAGIIFAAASRNARFGPLMTPDQAVAMAFAIRSIQFAAASVAISFFTW